MISLEEKSTIFIKHRELVAQAYNKFNENSKESKIYQIKSGLFNYQESKVPKKRKRRRQRTHKQSDSESSDLLNERELEIDKLENITNSVIKLLKEKHIYPDYSLDLDNNDFQFPNQIFVDQDFPKFNGENNTKSSIIYEMNNKKFLIPPKCRFFNYDIREITTINDSSSSSSSSLPLSVLDKYDFIILDPPWKNKYIRRIKKFKNEYGYQMLENDILAEIPLKNFIKKNSIVAIWCTNSPTHQKDIIEKLLPSWNLKLFKKLFWIKLNKNGDIICKFNDPGQKQPYEVIFVALHYDYITTDDDNDSHSILNKVDYIVSSASIIHSHKPPLLEIFEKYLPKNPKCLELFARYLYPGFTSIGLEVLKLMDIRLYDHCKK